MKATTLSESRVREFRSSLTSLNIADQRTIFSGMPAEMKSRLWKSRLLDAAKGAGTAQQKRLLRDLAARLSPAVYATRGSAERKVFKRYCAATWYPLALAAFSDRKKLVEISRLLGKPNRTAPFTQQVPKPPCDCNKAARGTGCDDCLLSNCKNVSCTSSLFGCGCFWTDPCDGVCK